MLTETTPVTLTTWQDQFSDWLIERGRSENTIASYLADLRVYCSWYEQANGQLFTPDYLTSTDARQFRTYTLQVQKRSPATWNRRRATLAVLCEWVEETYGITLFKFKSIPRAKEQQRAPGWVPQKDTRKLLRNQELGINKANTDLRKLAAIRDQAMISLMLYAGLRISEVVKLDLDDVTISPRSGSVRVRDSKGGKSGRLPLSASCRANLQAWLDARPQTEGDQAVFLKKHKGQWSRISVRGVQKRLEKQKNALNIEDLHAHGLRHRCIKNLFDAGMIAEAKEIARHSKLETTLRYATPSFEDLAVAVEAGELGKIYQTREV